MNNAYWMVRSCVGAVVGAVLLMAVPSGCGSSSKVMPGCMGAERCDCYPNLTCNSGLMCLSNLCVADGATSNGGTTGEGGHTGGGGTPGAAGATVNPGTGGTVNSGTGGTANPGSGGAANPGTGGMVNPGTGGAVNPGTGGAVNPGTGGAAVVGPNLIKNGDFALGKTYWDLTYQAGEIAGQDYSGGEYCVANLSTGMFLSFSLGYPPTPTDAFVIEPGGSYILSYRARFENAFFGALLPAMMVKIGHASPPYAPLISFTGDSIGLNYATFTHAFNGGVGDTGAGLVFNSILDVASAICFDDVRLVKN